MLNFPWSHAAAVEIEWLPSVAEFFSCSSLPVRESGKRSWKNLTAWNLRRAKKHLGLAKSIFPLTQQHISQRGEKITSLAKVDKNAILSFFFRMTAAADASFKIASEFIDEKWELSLVQNAKIQSLQVVVLIGWNEQLSLLLRKSLHNFLGLGFDQIWYHDKKFCCTRRAFNIFVIIVIFHWLCSWQVFGNSEIF